MAEGPLGGPRPLAEDENNTVKLVAGVKKLENYNSAVDTSFKVSFGNAGPISGVPKFRVNERINIIAVDTESFFINGDSIEQLAGDLDDALAENDLGGIAGEVIISSLGFDELMKALE